MGRGLLSVVATVLCIAVFRAECSDIIVQTTNGPVVGASHDGVEHFLGIPFAKPPVGDLRFRGPQPPESWTEPREAHTNPAACIQTGFSLQSFEETSEDCLYLNVFVPDEVRATGLDGVPVMVWIHGGAFTAGSAANYPADDLIRRAATPVIVVTINYRLGVFAYLTVDGVERNAGLLDQRMAMEWVQENAAAFGGDPDQVTLFGESAGGASVMFHLVMKDEPRRMFARGILESPGPWTYSSVESATESAVKYAASVGCDAEEQILECLQGLTVEELLAGRGIGMNPVMGYEALPEQPMHLMEKGDMWDVPLMLGVSEFEGDYFLDLVIGPEEISFAQYQVLITAILAPTGDVSRFKALYEPARVMFGNWRALAMATGDEIITCGAQIAANCTLHTASDLYSYVFTHTSPHARFNATHTSELPYVFAHNQEFTEADEAVVSNVVGWWTNFAATGNPNGVASDGVELPVWPVYHPDQQEEETVRNIEDDPIIPLWKPYERELCTLWNEAYFSGVADEAPNGQARLFQSFRDGGAVWSLHGQRGAVRTLLGVNTPGR